MNDLKIATVGVNRHGPAPVGAIDGNPAGLQPAEHAGVRMSIPVPGPHRDDRHPGPDHVQPCLTGGSGRAVVTHFEHLRLRRGVYQQGLGGQAGVAGQQGVEVAVGQADDHGILIGIQVGGHPGLGGVQNGQGDRIQPDGIAGASRPPGHAIFVRGPQQVQVLRRSHGLGRIQ